MGGRHAGRLGLSPRCSDYSRLISGKDCPNDLSPPGGLGEQEARGS